MPIYQLFRKVTTDAIVTRIHAEAYLYLPPVRKKFEKVRQKSSYLFCERHQIETTNGGVRDQLEYEAIGCPK